jgi:hypothetical protein
MQRLKLVERHLQANQKHNHTFTFTLQKVQGLGRDTVRCIMYTCNCRMVEAVTASRTALPGSLPYLPRLQAILSLHRSRNADAAGMSYSHLA